MKLNHTKGKVLLVCFLCVDTLLFASKHAKGMSLRYDTIFALSDNLISKDWFFAEGELFFYVFVSVHPQYLSTKPNYYLSFRTASQKKRSEIRFFNRRELEKWQNSYFYPFFDAKIQNLF